MFTRFDLTFLVAEPTRKGVGVHRQWSEYSGGYDVALAVVGNKVQHQPDADFLREHIGDGLLTCFSHEPALRAMERGRPFDLADLGPGARSALAMLQEAVDARVKDWASFTRQAVEFHLRNARAWANAAVGADLAAQVDPGFALSPGHPRPPAHDQTCCFKLSSRARPSASCRSTLWPRPVGGD